MSNTFEDYMLLDWLIFHGNNKVGNVRILVCEEFVRNLSFSRYAFLSDYLTDLLKLHRTK